MNKVDSFAKTTKNEISSIKDFSDKQKIAILSSFIKVNGTITIRDKNDYIELKIDNSKIAKFIFNCIQQVLKINPKISYLKRNNLKKNTCYIISFLNKNVLDVLHIDFFDNKINKIFSESNEAISGYLIGSFLATGSVNSPHTSNYHLEFSFVNENYTKWFIKLFKKYRNKLFTPKVVKRRNKYVVYIKKSEQISDLLKVLGATNACLYFENARVDRDTYNIENRFKNLDTANEMKIIDRANKDIEIIKKLISKYGPAFGGLKIATLCDLRIENPDASLNDLAHLMSEELHTNISKSNINHLLRAIRKKK